MMVSGCGRIGFDAVGHVATGGGDGGDSGDVGCASPGNPEHFTNASPACLGWGTVNASSANVMETSSELGIATTNAAGSERRLHGDGPVPFGPGILVEVGQIMAESQAITRLGLSSTSGVSAINASTVGVNFSWGLDTIGTVPCHPVAMRWWRIRPDLSSSEVRFETTPDDKTWTVQARTGAVILPTK